MRDMKSVTISNRSRYKILHIEAPGCIINVHVGLHDSDGRAVTSISVSPNGDRYSGEPEWWLADDDIPKSRMDGVTLRVVQEPDIHAGQPEYDEDA